MTLSEIKNHLKSLENIGFVLPDGSLVPSHFHVTELGRVTKHFIDCGGKERKEEVVNFQLWNANDYDHRLHPDKLLKIIELGENQLGLGDLPIEIEYQGDTIGKYGLDFKGKHFVLTTKQTDCLALSDCGIPAIKKKIKLATLQTADAGCCTPGGGCC